MLNIVLHQPQIPPNTGNIARLCVATKMVLHLVHPLGFRLDDSTLKRAGLDYWKDLTWYQYSSWEDFFNIHGKGRFYYYSKKVTQPYTQANYQQNDFLVFGSETKGLPESMLQKNATAVYTIPMWGPTRSLNLATSVGIVSYEALRQISSNFTQDLVEG